jgi:uncharacterized RDD family membrane protein YckC
MSTLILPASLPRRLAAAFYDGLLLLAMWMGVALLLAVLAPLLGGQAPRPLLQALFFIVGLVYFARSWTRGGMTLGLRSWHLCLRSDDGGAVSLTQATGRYLLMMLLCVIPALVGTAGAAGKAAPVAAFFLAIPAACMAWTLLDPQRRAWHDVLAGTEVVRVPWEKK